MQGPREQGLIKRGVFWLLLLGPLFFLSYGLSNGFTAGRDDVGTLVFDWERNIPLWSWSIVPYWSIDLLYGLSFLLPRNRREMDLHALRLLSAQLICVSCFLLWPLRFTFERPELAGVFGWLFDVLMGFDKPFNQAPSLHIALLVIIWAMFARHTRGPWLRGLMHGWMALIGLSVLTTWQHHFIDLPTGALAGFLCLWLWPREGVPPLRLVRQQPSTQRLDLATRYGLGTVLLVALAFTLKGFWLWLLWPGMALLMVALNYALFGAGGFQKRADGSLSCAVRWLLAPYLAAAWINSRLWTHRHPQADEVCDDVWLGRLPAKGEATAFAGVLDLCAELPMTPAYGQHYRSLPSLDLVVPDAELLREAAATLEALRGHGPLLVCCALGYSRSASVVAAWLLLSGRSEDVDGAEALIRKVRPGVVLYPAHRRVLEQLSPGVCP